MSESVELFFSYSHKDEALRDALATHLSNLEWQGIVSSWHDRKIVAGTEWDDEIKSRLDAADIILLLISPDFIASQYCRQVEIPQAMARHEAGEGFVIPVILRPFYWNDAPFAKLQAYPKDAKAVTLWSNQDEAFVSVTQGISAAAKLRLAQRQQRHQQKAIARSQYLKKVEEILSDGKISLVERDTLEELQQELGLSSEEAKTIEVHAFEPYKRYETNLEKYKQTLIKVIAHGYPLSDETKADLRLRQRDLGLKPDDVEQIEQSILAEAEARHQALQCSQTASPQTAQTQSPQAVTSEEAIDPVAESALAAAQVTMAEAQVAAQTEPPAPVDLRSAVGIDYSRLRDLLAAKQWQDADQETKVVMLGLAGRVAAGWLPVESLDALPAADLQTIDRLWMTYSNGRFGFTAQKQIFDSVSGDEGAFAERVGWRGKVGLFGGTFGWKVAGDLTYSLTAPAGHLPTPLFGKSTGAAGVLGVFSVFASKLLPVSSADAV
jgi:hypothetical protein